MICGAQHPDLGERSDVHGESLTPVVCTGRFTYADGKPIPHRGKHRARLGRVLLRWSDRAEAAS